jgi:hypothetical protein
VNWQRSTATSDAGSRRATALDTSIKTAKLNFIGPQVRLAHVLEHLPGYPAERIANPLTKN